MTSPFEMMQMAVDIVGTSPHPTNKIAATLSGIDHAGVTYTLSRTNCWPEAIEKKIGRDRKIGNSSGTIHAETACILAAPQTHDSSLFITDPPCPNCAKNMAEAGIRHLYIDHKGFEKDFAQRRGDDIRSMSLNILKTAGISVYEIFRKDRRIVPVIDMSSGCDPVQDDPLFSVLLESTPSHELFAKKIMAAHEHFKDQPFTLCFAERGDDTYMLSATIHPTPGFTYNDDLSGAGKYSFVLEPLNHIVMASKNGGYKILRDYVYSSRIPTARELVNYVGLGLQKITIGNDDQARDEGALQAKNILESHHVLEFLRFSPP
jgi:deoxycytidylate deaminase